MKIGELASATATKVETVRYYEKIGLLPPPARTSANYRAYGHDHLARMSFTRPDRWDVIGAAICLAGAGLILMGPGRSAS